MKRMWILVSMAALTVIGLAVILMVRSRRDESAGAHLPHDYEEFARRLETGDRKAFGPEFRVQIKPPGFKPDRTGDTLNQIISEVARVHRVERTTLAGPTRLADPPLSFEQIDFDELVMDLEKHFAIRLSDDDLGVTTGKTGTGPGAMTLGGLAEIIDGKLARK